MNSFEKKLENIENDTEIKIIRFLQRHGPAYYGDVVKSLKLSYKKGYEHLLSLKSKGLIKNTLNPSKLELNN